MITAYRESFKEGSSKLAVILPVCLTDRRGFNLFTSASHVLKPHFLQTVRFLTYSSQSITELAVVKIYLIFIVVHGSDLARRCKYCTSRVMSS